MVPRWCCALQGSLKSEGRRPVLRRRFWRRDRLCRTAECRTRNFECRSKAEWLRPAHFTLPIIPQFYESRERSERAWGRTIRRSPVPIAGSYCLAGPAGLGKMGCRFLARLSAQRRWLPWTRRRRRSPRVGVGAPIRPLVSLESPRESQRLVAPAPSAGQRGNRQTGQRLARGVVGY